MDAELYSLLLNVPDRQTEYDLLQREWVRREQDARKVAEGAAYDTDWCDLSGVRSGLAGCP